MPQIEVQTGALSAASARQQATGGSLRDLAGLLQATGHQAAAAAGDPAAADAASQCGTAIGSAVAALGDVVGSHAGNLACAASAYSGTDAGAIPAGTIPTGAR
jgi:hypothetical protein